MTQYINKSAVVAEIERLISNGQVKLQKSQENNDYENYVVWSEHIATCIKVLSFIDTLEVKDVNSTDAFIEKAISWLKEQDEMIGISFKEDFIERFKKYMEG